MLFQVMVSTGDAHSSDLFFYLGNRLSKSFYVEMDYVFCFIYSMSFLKYHLYSIHVHWKLGEFNVDSF